MKDITPAELSKAEAKKLTDRIRKHIDAAWADITRAHEGKAWKALGYRTWEAYVRSEFDMSRRRSYQLLDQGRVIQAISEAIGEDTQNLGQISKGDFGNNVKHVAQISARDVAAVKDDLPTVAEEIKAKVEAGEEPEKAVAETIAETRAVKEKAKAEKAVQQAENDKFREEAAAALPQAIKDREHAKADAVAARKAKPADVEALMAENEELREANAALETELATVKADNAKWEAMRVQFEQGGYDKVIAGKDEEIRALLTRVETESREKVSNLRSADR